MKDPNKVPIPSGNFVFIALCEDESGDRVPLALFNDLPLDLVQGSAIEIFVRGFRLHAVRIACLAHVVRSPMASRTA